MDVNCLAAWQLVCLRMRIQDVVSLLSTCRDLRSLSKKESLWSSLMRRDFPEHFPLAKATEMVTWYRDLHQFGGFFAVRTSIPLYPNRIIGIAAGIKVDHKVRTPDAPGKVITTRGRTSEYCFLRYPDQNFVCAVRKSMLTPSQSVFLPTIDSREVNHCHIRSLAMVFLHTKRPIRHFEMSHVFPFRETQFDETVKWMVKHFEVEESNYDEGEIEFFGRLRKGHILEPTSPGLSESLWTKPSKFKLKRNIFRSDKLNVVHVYSYLANSNFPTVDGEAIPCWKSK